jgi:endonuclease-3
VTRSKGGGPRQPLSRSKPGVAATRTKAAKTAPRTGGEGTAKRQTGRAKSAGLKPSHKAPTVARSPRTKKDKQAIADAVLECLLREYPDAHCELDFHNAFELLCATILSAQCTDARVNMVTPVLFARYPDARALSQAALEDVEEIVRSTGFFRAKSKSLVGMAGALVSRYQGEVPRSMVELVPLPGVGRKTANVVLGNAFEINEGIVVDTHVQRLARRLGLTREPDPVGIEQELMPLFPRERWAILSHLLIWHGRRVCLARAPRCGACTLREVCPSADRVE